MKRKRVCMSILLCCVALMFITGCSDKKKSKSLDEKLQGTVFSEMNYKVDKKGKGVYENEKYAVQMTDSRQGKGFYCCILAAWPKDGNDRKIANNCNALIGDNDEDHCISFGTSLPLSKWYKTYYENGITYICYLGNYTDLRADLRFQIADWKMKSGKVTKMLADIYVAPKSVEIVKKEKIGSGEGWKAYLQPDGSVVVCDGMKNYYISKLGIWFEDGRSISEKELTLKYKNGREEKLKRFLVSEPSNCKQPYKYITLWESDCFLRVENLKSMSIGEKYYQFQ